MTVLDGRRRDSDSTPPFGRVCCLDLITRTFISTKTYKLEFHEHIKTKCANTNWRLKYCNSVSIELLHFTSHFTLHHPFQVVLKSNVTKFRRDILYMDIGHHLLLVSDRLPTWNLKIFNIQVILYRRLRWESTCPQSDENHTI